jgi:hypothetical protein
MTNNLLIEGRQVPQPRYEREVAQLVWYYQEALLSIQAEIDRVDVKDFSRAQSLAMLKEVERALKKVDRKSKAWIDENIPAAANAGRASTLVSLGLVKDMEEAKKVLQFNKLDTGIVEKAVADLQNDLLAVTQNMGAKAVRVVRSVVAVKMSASMTAGVNGRKAISRDIEQRLKERLKDAADEAIVDAAKRTWKVEHYVDMVTRTKMLETYRSAKTEEALERGSQYAIVTTNGGTKDACRFHEGRIIKLDPSAEGSYMTYEELKASNQIFHPNCKHHILPFRRFDRLPQSVLNKAELQERRGRAAMETGKRAPEERAVRRAAYDMDKIEPPKQKALTKQPDTDNSISSRYVEAKTTKEANEWAKKNLPIAQVDYGKHDVRLANDLNKTYALLMDRYPEIRNIKYAGTMQARNKLLWDRKVDDYYKKLRSNPNNDTFSDKELLDYAKKKVPKRKESGNTFAQAANHTWGELEGVTFNEKWAKDYDALLLSKRSCETSQWHAEATGTPAAIVTHEFGHMIHYFLRDLKLAEDLDELAGVMLGQGTAEIKKQLSEYAAKNIMEIVAEGFAEYIHNPNPRNWARRVGETIDEALEKYRKAVN